MWLFQTLKTICITSFVNCLCIVLALKWMIDISTWNFLHMQLYIQQVPKMTFAEKLTQFSTFERISDFYLRLLHRSYVCMRWKFQQPAILEFLAGLAISSFFLFASSCLSFLLATIPIGLRQHIHCCCCYGRELYSRRIMGKLKLKSANIETTILYGL